MGQIQSKASVNQNVERYDYVKQMQLHIYVYNMDT